MRNPVGATASWKARLRPLLRPRRLVPMPLRRGPPGRHQLKDRPHVLSCGAVGAGPLRIPWHAARRAAVESDGRARAAERERWKVREAWLEKEDAERRARAAARGYQDRFDRWMGLLHSGAGLAEATVAYAAVLEAEKALAGAADVAARARRRYALTAYARGERLEDEESA